MRATTKKQKEIVKRIKQMIEKYPMDSHYLIARLLNNKRVRTLEDKEWSSENLRLFMKHYGITHRMSNGMAFNAQLVISENRPESRRLL